MNTHLNLTRPYRPLNHPLKTAFALALLFTLLIGCEPRPHYDIIIRNGLLLDGSGNPGSTLFYPPPLPLFFLYLLLLLL